MFQLSLIYNVSGKPANNVLKLFLNQNYVQIKTGKL
jgi:hypothetical protein